MSRSTERLLQWGDEHLDELTAWFRRLAMIGIAGMMLTVCSEITQTAYRMGYDDAKAGKVSALETKP